MLINLSNHSIKHWSKEQFHAASVYGELVDLPFPAVDPHGDEDYINRLTDEYLIHIKSISGNDELVVHLMGEMNFCFALIQKLKAAGILALASCTDRNTFDLSDGKKEVHFRFVQFRQY